ncbi:MAG TPA: methyltransferase domain-containing protein [Acidobacteriota bacterium]|nr:methyltransferase domain-containing protein [Acidobacteriota bacterium]
MIEEPRIFDLLANLADTTRTRLLLVLEGQEFTVGELCTVLQMPQSTVSRHLKVLVEDGWLAALPDGTSRRYRMLARSLDPDAAELWALVRERSIGLPAAGQDAARVRSVLTARRSRSQEFFASAAGDWDRLRRDMFGERVDLQALLGLADPDWVVGDLGCGTGRVAESLAPFVRRVVAVDSSREMFLAARDRLREADNIDVREGRLESLPLADGELDVALMFLVLHYVVQPEIALAEAARTLRPNGRLPIADMTPHDRRVYQHDMGHAWLGFERQQVAGWLRDAGLDSITYHELPPDPDASGPAIFVASARRGADPDQE